MGQLAKNTIDIRDFPGQIDATDTQDVPPGAAEEQLNVCSLLIGELTVRRGYRVVTFETE